MKIGDRVRITTDVDTLYTGCSGNVIYVDPTGLVTSVEVQPDGFAPADAEVFYEGEYELLVEMGPHGWEITADELADYMTGPFESPHYFVD
jgi:hypothetical protein